MGINEEEYELYQPLFIKNVFYVVLFTFTECSNVKFEDGCYRDCGYCRNMSQCHHENGSCVNGCEPGYKQYDCKQRMSKYPYFISILKCITFIVDLSNTSKKRKLIR